MGKRGRGNRQIDLASPRFADLLKERRRKSRFRCTEFDGMFTGKQGVLRIQITLRPRPAEPFVEHNRRDCESVFLIS